MVVSNVNGLKFASTGLAAHARKERSELNGVSLLVSIGRALRALIRAERWKLLERRVTEQALTSNDLEQVTSYAR